MISPIAAWDLMRQLGDGVITNPDEVDAAELILAGADDDDDVGGDLFLGDMDDAAAAERQEERLVEKIRETGGDGEAAPDGGNIQTHSHAKSRACPQRVL
jgi:hypothetical protein